MKSGRKSATRREKQRQTRHAPRDVDVTESSNVSEVEERNMSEGDGFAVEQVARNDLELRGMDARSATAPQDYTRAKKHTVSMSQAFHIVSHSSIVGRP